MIDCRYNPPAHDILCFFQFSTTRKLREDHSSELFQIYYDTFANCLISANLDPDVVFPAEDFHRSIEEMRTSCMLHGVLNTPVMLLDPKAVEKYFNQELGGLESLLFVDRTPLICGQFNEVELYRARMIDGLLELYDQLIR